MDKVRDARRAEEKLREPEETRAVLEVKDVAVKEGVEASVELGVITGGKACKFERSLRIEKES